MSNADDELRAVLSGYEKFLQDKGLAVPKHRPYLNVVNVGTLPR